MNTADRYTVDRFVFALDAEGKRIKHHRREKLDAWVQKYTRYPQMPGKDVWIVIPGKHACFFDAHGFCQFMQVCGAYPAL
jgi:hypothetical protein